MREEGNQDELTACKTHKQEVFDITSLDEDNNNIWPESKKKEDNR